MADKVDDEVVLLVAITQGSGMPDTTSSTLPNAGAGALVPITWTEITGVAVTKASPAKRLHGAETALLP